MKNFYGFIGLLLFLTIPSVSYSQVFDTLDFPGGECLELIGSQTPLNEMPSDCLRDYGRHYIFIDIDFSFEEGAMPTNFEANCYDELIGRSSGNICSSSVNSFVRACLQDLNMAIDDDCFQNLTLSEAINQCPEYTPHCSLNIN